MKANEAPEKVYIHKSQYWGLIANEHNITKNGIEYTRTDAFIDKACDAFCKVCKMPNCRRNECKAISDFKEYLETI